MNRIAIIFVAVFCCNLCPISAQNLLPLPYNIKAIYTKGTRKMNQYIGTQQFYNDFCNFKTSITAPDNYLVWVTGDLKNCSQVLTKKYYNPIQRAEVNDAIMDMCGKQKNNFDGNI